MVRALRAFQWRGFAMSEIQQVDLFDMTDRKEPKEKEVNIRKVSDDPKEQAAYEEAVLDSREALRRR